MEPRNVDINQSLHAIFMAYNICIFNYIYTCSPPMISTHVKCIYVYMVCIFKYTYEICVGLGLSKSEAFTLNILAGKIMNMST